MLKASLASRVARDPYNLRQPRSCGSPELFLAVADNDKHRHDPSRRSLRALVAKNSPPIHNALLHKAA
ncbi:hypothetical protein [Xanthomonas hortorum]|uniref:hypothetical protein n=1 Tax=Xanthomonas hortorum TaxID=56454 RepID=UPI000CEEDB3D|nr:hypothetical protein [Xanthomonas hortorum]MCE4347836.1 hypothetical protein [Xanthomonas hortorum pv. cynarae]PPU48999.1 hypothetical protein XcyCFBP4188_03520 [Xanthomonas hortorum pv. cynarae]